MLMFFDLYESNELKTFLIDHFGVIISQSRSVNSFPNNHVNLFIITLTSLKLALNSLTLPKL